MDKPPKFIQSSCLRRPSLKGSKKNKWYFMDAMEFLNYFVGVHRKLGSNTKETPNETLRKTQSEVDVPVTLGESLDQSDELPFQPPPRRI